MQLDVVGYSVWLKKLEVACEGHSVALNAALLLQFFRDVDQKQVSDREAFGLPILGVSNTISLSKSLKCAQLGEEDVKGWVKYWRNISLVKGN